MDRPDLTSALNRVRQHERQVRALVDGPRLIESGTPLATPTADGLLSGWPVVVKDVIDVGGVHTGCNADFLPIRPAESDAGIVRKLREAGATILAKAVTTSFAFYDPGPTGNPWNLDHTPGGSSSGSAAAVAAGMARLAIGTQTVGSINRPASFCGVVGFKPTYGQLPIDGVFPLSAPLDTVGYLTNSAADARTAFEALTGKRAESPDRLSVAVLEDLLCPAPAEQMLEALRGSRRLLAEGGHAATQTQLDPRLAAAYPRHWSLTAHGAAEAHTALFAEHRDRYPTKLRELIEKGLGVTDAQRSEIGQHQRASQAIVGEFLSDYDVVLSVSAPGPAPRGLGATGDPRCNLLWTYLGLPTLTLPVQLTSEGLPLGLQLTAGPGEDAKLLAMGERIAGIIEFSYTPPAL